MTREGLTSSCTHCAHSNSTKRVGGWVVAVLMCLALPQGVQAARDLPPASANGAKVGDQEIATPKLELNNVGDKTDEELTALTAQWGQLSAAERRVLLAEVRTRMQLRQRTAQRSPRVTVTRRYGRIVRKRDGSVVVQTQIIRPRAESNAQVMQQASQGASQGQMRRHGRVTFGFGFERRGAHNTVAQAKNAEEQSVPVGEDAAEHESGTVILPDQSSTESR